MRFKTVGVLSVALVLAVAVAGCGPTQKPAAPAPGKPKITAAVRRGAKLFVDYACVHCHGVRGDGNAKLASGQPTGAPALNGVSASMVRQYLGKGPVSNHIVSLDSQGNAVDNGQINMPYWYGILNTQQVDDLAAYISAGLPKISGVSDTALSANTGPEIYTSFACVKCHGPYNVGGMKNQGAVDLGTAGAGDAAVPILGPKGDEVGPASAHWNTPYKAASKWQPTLGGKMLTGEEFLKDKLLLGSIIHDGYSGGAPNTLLMPAWGQLMSSTQLTTILNYLRTGK